MEKTKKINIGFQPSFDHITIESVKKQIRQNKEKSKVLLKDAPLVSKYLKEREMRRWAREKAEKAHTERIRYKKDELLKKYTALLKGVINFSDFTKKRNVDWGWGGFSKKWWIFEGEGKAYTAKKGHGMAQVVRHAADIKAISTREYELYVGGGWDKEEHTIIIPHGYVFDFKNERIIKIIAINAYYLFNGKKYQLVVSHKNEEYHDEWRKSEYSEKVLQKKIAEFIQKIKERRQKHAKELLRQRYEKRRWEEIVSHTWVSVEDSIEAGNCKSRTLEFANKVKEMLGIDSTDVCVRASDIIKIRDDFYVRRAIQKASVKFFNNAN